MYSRLKTLLVNILNLFALPGTANTTARSTSIIVSLMLFLCVALCAWVTLGKVPDKFVIMVDEFTLGDTNTLSIGHDDDVVINNVPKGFLTISHQGDRMLWRVNDQHADTLQYFKINNHNPNLFEVKDDPNQKITVTLSSPNTAQPLRLQLTGEEIWRQWHSFSRQSDVLLRHFAAHYICSRENATHDDSLSYKSQMDQPNVRSFLHATHNMFGGIATISLVVLDRFTTIDGKGYQLQGEVAQQGEYQGKCKVQFFNVNTYSYKDQHHNDGYFEIDDVNYAMKATPLLTPWGAGHVMLISHNAGFRVVFPKALGYVGTVDSLRAKAAGTSNVISFQQTEEAFPTPSDMYLPYFSQSVNRALCSLHFSSTSPLTLSDNNSNSYTVANGSMPLLPALTPLTLHSANNTLAVRTGIINTPFMLSYLYLPLIVTIILLIITLCPYSPLRPKSFGGTYCFSQLKALPLYVAMITIVAMVYCICKSMIALKLSYTYPYFEDITVITPFNTSMTLLLFFTLAMIINYPLTAFTPKKTAYHHRQKRSNRRALYTAIVLAVVFIGLTAMFFMQTRWGIASSIIDAYFPSNINMTLNWMSDTAYGVKDHHLTVPYALIAIEAIMLVILITINIFGVSRLHNAVNHIKVLLIEQVKPILIEQVERIKHSITLPAIVSNIHVPNIVSNILQGAKGAICRALLWSLLLAIIGSVLGNFGTAFITLGVIIGMTNALSKVTFSEETPRYITFLQMLIITLLFIIGAMYADNGYITNYLGFILILFTYYFIIKHPGRYGAKLTRLEKRERQWVVIALVSTAVFIVIMPWLCSKFTQTDRVNYSRLSRRVMLYSSFNDLQQSGYRYAESDAEFMAVMSHYMQYHDQTDPLSNDSHPLHQTISSGQSPVLLNDLSLPVAFIASYGITAPTAIYFILLISLIILVLQFSFAYTGHMPLRLTHAMQWRLLALFMWVGTTIYIYLSYIDQLPFTGRLNPGFGVDAVGEALETALLLAFMTAVTVRELRVES